MSRSLNLALSLAAGLLGGMVSRWVIPTPVLAQAPMPAPKDVRAQRFTLVTEDGRVLGVFGSDQPLDAGNNPARRPSASANALPTIKLFDPSGKEIWSAGGSGFRTLSVR
jgi:hypothetical protein